MGPAIKRRVTKTVKDEVDQEEVHPARKIARVAGDDSAKKSKRVNSAARSPKDASEELDGLKGLKVVLTGLTDIYTRDDLEARLKNVCASAWEALCIPAEAGWSSRNKRCVWRHECFGVRQ